MCAKINFVKKLGIAAELQDNNPSEGFPEVLIRGSLCLSIVKSNIRASFLFF